MKPREMEQEMSPKWDRSPEWLKEKERRDFEYWQQSPVASPRSETTEYLISRAGKMKVFWEKLTRHLTVFERAQTILELGAGQCWASCIVKKEWPDKRVVATDLAPAAVESAHRWERIFDVKLDGVCSSPGYATPFRDQSFDLVFCFAAAHHFVRHRETFAELHRVLRKGGTILYMHETGCRRIFYPLIFKHVSGQRSDMFEDALVYRELSTMAADCGLDADVVFDPTLTDRGPFETLYFSLLKRSRWLQSLLPCSIDMVLTRI